MFHYTIESVGTVEETIHALGLQLQTEQFGVLWSFNIQDKLKEKGIAKRQPTRHRCGSVPNAPAVQEKYTVYLFDGAVPVPIEMRRQKGSAILSPPTQN